MEGARSSTGTGPGSPRTILVVVLEMWVSVQMGAIVVAVGGAHGGTIALGLPDTQTLDIGEELLDGQWAGS